MRNSTKSQRRENVQECSVWESRGERVVNVYKCRQRGGAEEIGTLRFGWLEKSGWERLGAAQSDPARYALDEPETFR
jgi:hypothetical protein